ncbi:MAG: LUD domain-containing protein [Spirochaetaceae bacterium]|nr:LUD domain-containing protein [Spirochaetaceae bacterium]
MSDFGKLASREAIERTVAALRANGIEASVAATGAEAAKQVLAMIPAGSEVFTASSITLEQTGISKELNESGRYQAVKPKLYSMDPKTQGREMRKLGAAPDVVVGSAHAVTEGGSVLVASLTGSQLPAYAYGAGSLIWVVGAQKLVKDVEEGMRRIEEKVVPLESERARAAYGLPEGFRTFASKVLIFNREVQGGRVKMVIVEESLGF